MGVKNFFWYALFWWANTGELQGEEDCTYFGRIFYEKPGNVSITGIFDGNTGENCTFPDEFGVEEMAAAVWTITALERYNYLPGIRLGLTLFDACRTIKMAQEAFADAVMFDSCYSQNVSNIGILASPEIESKLTSNSSKSNRTVTRLEHFLDLEGVLNIVVELLTNLHWTTVNRIIADSRNVLSAFSQRLSDEGICLYDEALATNTYAVNNEVLVPAHVPEEDLVSKDIPVIVVLCKSDSIEDIFEGLTPEMRNLPVRWLLVPTDFVLNLPNVDLPENVYSVLPLVEKRELLLRFLSDGEMQKDHMNHKKATRSPLFVRVAAGILQLLEPLKTIQDEHCPGKNLEMIPCPEVMRFLQDLRKRRGALQGPKSVSITSESIMNTLKVLKIDANENEMFLFIASLVKKNEKTEDAAIFQIFDAKVRAIKPVLLILNEKLFSEGFDRVKRASKIFKLSVDDLEKIKRKEDEESATYESDKFTPYEKHPCADILTSDNGNSSKHCGICQNFIKFFVIPTLSMIDSCTTESVPVTWSWRNRTWVAINTSVAFIGVMCTLAVMTFISFRMFKGDVLEGNPFFSFLILSSIILLYTFTLPFSVDHGEDFSDFASILICRLRFISPAVGYSILFSVLLSRTAMLISSELDGGIMNHVSGCLQGILCFFMCFVQVALTVQFWFYNMIDSNEDCFVMHSDGRFVIQLSYSFFLLVLLAFASPFTIRCKRNYKEGFFFSIAVLIVIVVWSLWLTFYYLLPVEHKDAAIALGLTGTSTSVLLLVFIPRTYLMTTAIVREKMVNTLPSLAYINHSNISELNYRSNQALCDTVTVRCSSPKFGYSNARIYSVQVSRSVADSPNNSLSNSSRKDDGTEYVLKRNKNFVDVSRSNSPESLYETYETSDMTGKITKF